MPCLTLRQAIVAGEVENAVARITGHQADTLGGWRVQHHIVGQLGLCKGAGHQADTLGGWAAPHSPRTAKCSLVTRVGYGV